MVDAQNLFAFLFKSLAAFHEFPLNVHLSINISKKKPLDLECSSGQLGVQSVAIN